ncbi:MAG: XRE family transcriptional regulator [Candidatus Accumulibacter sp.]|nr:XRE family transcriptional regulator [Candidatus Accumulibacter necessarius]
MRHRVCGLSRADGVVSAGAERLGTVQSRLSDLMRNKYDKFGLDMLVMLATRAGRRVELALV